VSRQLLPRPSTRTPAPRGRRASTARATAGAAPSEPTAPSRVLRRPAVLALVAAGAVVLAGLAWTFLSSPRTTEPVSASVLVRPRPPGTTSPGTPSVSVAGLEQAPVGRNPFGSAPAPGAPTTSARLAASPTPPPSGLPAAVPPATAGVPTGAPTTRPSTSGSPSAAPTVTVTVTASGGPTYVGLYAWNGSRASFRVNARTYSMHVGAQFGPGLTFAAIVTGDPPCARLTHGKDSFTLCPGQVTALP
jgi:hypothetical protein